MTAGKELKRRYRGPLDRDLRTSPQSSPEAERHDAPAPSLDRCLRCSSGVLDSRLPGGMCGDWRFGECPMDDPTPEEIEANRTAACACCDLSAMGGCDASCFDHADHQTWLHEQRDREREEEEEGEE